MSGTQTAHVVDFTPLSDDGATTQMGDQSMVPKIDMLSSDGDGIVKNQQRAPGGPSHPMYLNMDQVHKNNVKKD